MKTKHSTAGFTLVEMSVVLIIVGIMIAAFAGPYSIYVKKKQIDGTQRVVETVTDKIGEFRTANGRYPCPASLTATRDDEEYGRESDCESSSVAVGDPVGADGYYIQENTRAVGATNLTQRIRVGAVPFRQLNLDESDAYDAYGGRLLYAVTEELAQDGQFDISRGGIQIVDASGASAIEPPGSAHFILLSHGANQSGAYTQAGALIPCPATGTEAENCNISDEGIYTVSQKVGRAGATEYDDIVSYFTAADVPAWQPSGTDNITMIPTNDGAVHIVPPNAATPSNSVRDPVNDPLLNVRNTMKVDGTSAATERGVHVNQICAADGTGCFPSSVIAGNDPNMACPANQVVVRIENSRVVCRPVASLSSSCPANRYLVGFESDGSPICEGPPAITCPARSFNVCGTNHNIPAGYNGQTYWIEAGLSLRRQYVCRNSQWRYVNGTETGLCTCTPGTETATLACDAGFTGTRRVERQYTCPSGTFTGWVEVTGGNNCVCNTDTQSYTEACPAGFTGERRYSRSHVCPTSGAPYWTNYTLVSNTCTCVPSTQARDIACSGGLDGRIYQERDFTCPGGTYSPWRETRRTCSCTPTTEQYTEACPAGYEGSGIVMRRSRTCSGTTSTWSAWTEASRSCTLIPPTVCTLQPNSAGTGGSTPYAEGPSVGRTCTSCGTTSNCSRSNGDGTYTNYPSCTCR